MDQKKKYSNYRLISLLSTFLKLFEKCIHKQLYSSFNKYKILAPNYLDLNKTAPLVRLKTVYDELAENLQ